MVVYIMMCAAVVTAVIQTVLCMKNIRRIWKFLPLILCTAATAGLFLLSFLTTGWTSVGYWLFACFSPIPIAGCGLGWLIAFLIQKFRK